MIVIASNILDLLSSLEILRKVSCNYKLKFRSKKENRKRACRWPSTQRAWFNWNALSRRCWHSINLGKRKRWEALLSGWKWMRQKKPWKKIWNPIKWPYIWITTSLQTFSKDFQDIKTLDWDLLLLFGNKRVTMSASWLWKINLLTR